MASDDAENVITQGIRSPTKQMQANKSHMNTEEKSGQRLYNLRSSSQKQRNSDARSTEQEMQQYLIVSNGMDQF